MIHKTIDTIEKTLANADLPDFTKRMLVSMRKELEVCERCNNCRAENQKKANLVKKRKLQVGCGKNCLKDFVNLDICEPADIIWDVRNGLPFKDNMFDVIFSEHFLEHIDFPNSVCLFIKEAYRVLRKNGKMIIGIPDTGKLLQAYGTRDKAFFEELIRRWYSSRDCLEFMDSPMNCVNYHMRDQLYHHKYSSHLWGYDEENLTNLLKRYNFSNIRRWQVNEKWVNPKRVWGSLYLIGEKNV
ncbi:MAG: class I SAM-dependent methyltransferase [Alphaproteobacteria bacterium]|nr:class I SAM-dependent methyltransferase [Alphaproteobacteria bacterium]